jgi:hypothetical protein
MIASGVVVYVSCQPVGPPVMRLGSAHPSNPRKSSVGRATSLPKKDIRSYHETL